MHDKMQSSDLSQELRAAANTAGQKHMDLGIKVGFSNLDYEKKE